MPVMFSGYYYDVNVAMKCVIKLHVKHMFCWFIGVIEHRVHCSPKVEGSVTTLIKKPCNKVNKGKIRPRSWDTYSKLNVGKKHPSGCHFSLLRLNKLAKAKRH